MGVESGSTTGQGGGASHLGEVSGAFAPKELRAAGLQEGEGQWRN